MHLSFYTVLNQRSYHNTIEFLIIKATLSLSLSLSLCAEVGLASSPNCLDILGYLLNYLFIYLFN
jgi:hypothetical protein